MKLANFSLNDKQDVPLYRSGKLLDRKGAASLGGVIAVLVIIQLSNSAVWLSIGTTVAISAIAAMALTVLIGWAGQPSLLAGASLLIGGICAAAVPTKTPGSLFIALIAALVLGGIIGAVAALPSRRLSGTYLLLSTMGLQFIIVDIVNYVQSKTGKTGGYYLGSPSLFIFSVKSPHVWLWVCGVALLLVYVYLFYLRHTRIGRSLAIIRDDPGAASVAGVKMSSHLTWIFVITSALISMAGVLDGYYTQNVTYEGFGVLVSISFFVMIVLGGPGSLMGAILGCAFVVGMPQILPLVYSGAGQSATLPYVEQLIYGLFGALVLVLRFGRVPMLHRLSKAFITRQSAVGTVHHIQAIERGLLLEEEQTTEANQSLTDISVLRINGDHKADPDNRGLVTGKSEVLRLSNLHVSYRGSITAVRGVNLTLTRGQAIAIVGPNGAGKTSVLSAVAGFYEGTGGYVSEGQVLLADAGGHIDISERSPAERGRLGIAFVPAEDKVFNDLYVYEHLRLATPKGLSTSEIDLLKDELFQVFPEIEPLLQRRAGLLSGGQRQQVAVLCALLRRPRILVVDELSLGLSPIAIERLLDALLRVKKLGNTSLLLAEQNVSLAFALSDLIITMSGGLVKSFGKPSPDFEDAVRLEFVGARVGPSSPNTGASG